MRRFYGNGEPVVGGLFFFFGGGGWNEWEKRDPIPTTTTTMFPTILTSCMGRALCQKPFTNGNPRLWSRERGDKKWTKLASGPFVSQKGLAGFGISGQKSVIDELGPSCCYEIYAETTEQEQFVKNTIPLLVA